jgi:adenosylhomocysteine nucleosidase
MPLPCAAALVVPTEGELRPFFDLLPNLQRLSDAGPWETYAATVAESRIVLIHSLAGPVNAAAATERLIAQYAPGAIFNGGAVGALVDDLLPGDVILGARCVIAAPPAVREARTLRGLRPSLLRFRRHGETNHVDYLEPGAALLARARAIVQEEARGWAAWEIGGWPGHIERRGAIVVEGTLASADAWTLDHETTADLREHYGASGEDMESAYVAQVCAIHAMPFLAVRVVSDNERASALDASEVQAVIAAAGVRAATILARLARELCEDVAIYPPNPLSPVATGERGVFPDVHR